MPYVLSVATATPEFEYTQQETQAFVQSFFKAHVPHLDRLLQVFDHGQIERRYLSAPLEWFEEKPSFQERNKKYIETAVRLGSEVIEKCLESADFLTRSIKKEEIDAIIFVSTTGLSTPSIDVRLINKLGFRSNIKRIPLWGLGCAGGTAGLARANEYCRANPEETVLLICLECCSLAFQSHNHSKSQLIGTSLFADGAACVCVIGDQSPLMRTHRKPVKLSLGQSTSLLLPDSEEVMGWDVKDDGLHVVFSKSIPDLVRTWLKGAVEEWSGKSPGFPGYIIAHPGGKKVLDALEDAFQLLPEQLGASRAILNSYGNMSSPTVLFVLEKIMVMHNEKETEGIMLSMGPGFCAECLNVAWEAAQ
jgi:alkylresorcinol/alkylpyrone synthase